jgi:hypothetical protein
MKVPHGEGLATHTIHTGDFRVANVSRLQPFLYVQAPRFARHSGRPHNVYNKAAVTFTSGQNTLCYQKGAADMLAVRTGKLTAGDFNLIRSAALLAAPQKSLLQAENGYTQYIEKSDKKSRALITQPSPYSVIDLLKGN